MKLSSIDSISAPQNQAFCTRDVSFLNSFENVSFLNSFENVLTNKIVWKLMLFWKKIPLSHLSLFHHQYSLSLSLWALKRPSNSFTFHTFFFPFILFSFWVNLGLYFIFLRRSGCICLACSYTSAFPLSRYSNYFQKISPFFSFPFLLGESGIALFFLSRSRFMGCVWVAKSLKECCCCVWCIVIGLDVWLENTLNSGRTKR